MHTLSNLYGLLPTAQFTLVLNHDWVDYWQQQCKSFNFKSPVIVNGGATRWESVKNAIANVADSADIIMVHDGARPFPTANMLNQLVEAIVARNADGAVPAVDVTDSLRIICDGTTKPFDRSKLKAVQTPQAFRADLLSKAYELPYQATFTDDASVMEAAGFNNIELTQGEPTNIKITHPIDVAIAQAIITSTK
jgi:2-C-methyl-D-erythritol 4-phosphate cytidylyltransferase